MQRDGMRSGAKFEPASIASKADVTAKATRCVAGAFDVESGEVIHVDLTEVRVADGMRVDGHDGRYGDVLRAVLDLPLTRTTAWDVLATHATSRGTIVGAREEADVAFDATGLDLNDLAFRYVDALDPGLGET